jgi:hypothetical protein
MQRLGRERNDHSWRQRELYGVGFKHYELSPTLRMTKTTNDREYRIRN